MRKISGHRSAVSTQAPGLAGTTSPFERITPDELAADYKIPVSSLKVMRWNRAHQRPGRNPGPPFERAGRKILYRRTDIEAWLASQRVENPGETVKAA